MVAYTTTYSFAKPTVGDDEDVWGGYLNGNFDTLESLLKGTTSLTAIDVTGTITTTGQLTIDNDNGLKAVYGTETTNVFYTGYGIDSQRGTTYIRPTNDNTQTLYIGNFNDTLDWNTIAMKVGDDDNVTINNNKVFHAGNDGSGSGLDADTVDGIQASSFLRSDANDTATGELTFNSKLDIANGTYLGWGGGTNRPSITGNKTSNVMLFYAGGSEKLRINTSGIDITGTVTADQVDISSTTQIPFNVEYANDGAGVGPVLRTFRDSASPAASDALGGIDFKGNNSAGSEKFYARIKGLIIDPTDTTEDGGVEISVSKAGTAAWEGSARVAKFDPDGMELRGDIIFEGSTANNSETTLTVTDPTADRTITLPDATGTVWTSGNDGSGSGLDADTVDGIQASSFLRSDAADSGTGSITLTTGANPAMTLVSNDFGEQLIVKRNHASNAAGINFQNTSGSQGTFFLDSTGPRWNNGFTSYKVWHETNDGSGSGLDADTLDGVQGSSYLRSDASDTFTGTLTVNGNVIVEDNRLYVGDYSNDNMAGVWQDTTNGRGFTYEYPQAAVFSNQQGSTEQYLVLGDSGTSSTSTLLGVSTYVGGNYYTRLNLKGNGDLDVTGALTATSKSFVIDHPTKEGMMLRHGSLEGPEDGVYVRGRLTGKTVIELPDYWTGLVHEDSITVQLTAMGGKADLWVESIADNKVTVGCDTEVDCFYFVQATRKDVDEWDVEYVADS